MNVLKEIFKQLVFLVLYLFLLRYVLISAASETLDLVIKNSLIFSLFYTFVISIPLAFNSRNNLSKGWKWIFIINFLPLIAVLLALVFQNRIEDAITNIIDIENKI